MRDDGVERRSNRRSVRAIYEQNITPDRLETPDEAMRRMLLTAGAKAAQAAAANFTEDWQKSII